MNRILIGILAILILIATRPIATVVADGDDSDGISLNCNLELAFDIFALEQGYRVGAFLGLGGILVLGGFLYQRYSRAIRGFLLE